MDVDVDREATAAVLLFHTPSSISYDRLRSIKNSLVGNPSAKLSLARSDLPTIRA